LALCLAIAGCGLLPQRDRDPAMSAQVAGADTPRPEGRPGSGGIAPPAGARTAEAFDTTTAEERVAALAAPATGTRSLGTTIASLGSPADAGFWLRTPLVTAVTPGRVTHAPSGASVRVELRPSGGAAGSGSQLSLPAFRAMELPLTGLPELRVEAE
jgi:hypothetical protein